MEENQSVTFPVKFLGRDLVGCTLALSSTWNANWQQIYMEGDGRPENNLSVAGNNTSACPGWSCLLKVGSKALRINALATAVQDGRHLSNMCVSNFGKTAVTVELCNSISKRMEWGKVVQTFLEGMSPVVGAERDTGSIPPSSLSRSS